jgi:pyruvate formate lyase activating enzyme
MDSGSEAGMTVPVIPIGGMVKTSTVDFLGRLSAVLFTIGCNYDCWYCHNRALISNQHPRISDTEVRAFLEKRRGLLEGIVLSGGEPTLQPDLIDFATYLKDLGYAVKLDTNGSNPQVLKELLKRDLLDYVALDYKTPFTSYPLICKHNATGVKECINLLQDYVGSVPQNAPSAVANPPSVLRNAPYKEQPNFEWELRTTVLPELDEAALTRMALEVPKLPRYIIQSYVPEASAPHQTRKELDALAQTLKPYQPNIAVR